MISTVNSCPSAIVHGGIGNVAAVGGWLHVTMLDAAR
jgi:hypothetical protein